MRLTQICGEVIYGSQNAFLTEVVQSSSFDAERIHLQKQLVFCLQKASVANMLSQIGDFDTTVALNVLKIIAEGALNLKCVSKIDTFNSGEQGYPYQDIVIVRRSALTSQTGARLTGLIKIVGADVRMFLPCSNSVTNGLRVRLETGWPERI